MLGLVCFLANSSLVAEWWCNANSKRIMEHRLHSLPSRGWYLYVSKYRPVVGPLTIEKYTIIFARRDQQVQADCGLLLEHSSEGGKGNLGNEWIEGFGRGKIQKVGAEFQAIVKDRGRDRLLKQGATFQPSKLSKRVVIRWREDGLAVCNEISWALAMIIAAFAPCRFELI